VASFAIIAVPVLASAYHAFDAVRMHLMDFDFPLFLLIIYFAALQTAVGGLIYKLRCPEKIKEHKTLPTYAAHIGDLAMRLVDLEKISTSDRRTSLRQILTGDGMTANLTEEQIDKLCSLLVDEVDAQGLKLLNLPPSFLAYRRQLLDNCLNTWTEDNERDVFSRFLVTLFFYISGLLLFILAFIITPTDVIIHTGAI
jgi:hypothetical protein